MLDVVILVNLFSNMLLTLIANHIDLLYSSDVITWNKSVMHLIVLCVRSIKWNMNP